MFEICSKTTPRRCWMLFEISRTTDGGNTIYGSTEPPPTIRGSFCGSASSKCTDEKSKQHKSADHCNDCTDWFRKPMMSGILGAGSRSIGRPSIIWTVSTRTRRIRARSCLMSIASAVASTKRTYRRKRNRGYRFSQSACPRIITKVNCRFIG